MQSKRLHGGEILKDDKTYYVTLKGAYYNRFGNQL